MANAMTCAECGKQLTPSDRFCSQCGARVEKETSSSLTNVALTSCEVCGHTNAHSGAYCEACGAKLSGRKHASQKPSSERQSKSTSSQQSGRLEPWHYIVGVLIAAVVGVFVYFEATKPTVSTAQQPVQMEAMPQAPVTPPSKEVLDAIARLESTVKQNPNDVGAKLLLANALHDAGTHDGSYFPRAIEAYKTYLKEKPGDPNARVDLGICYFELGKIDSTQSLRLFSMAISEMESTLKNNPKHQAGAFNLGIVYLFSGDFEQSNKWFKKAVELNAESDLGKRAKAILEQHSQAG